MSKAARERSARDRLAVERKRQAARDKQRRLLTIVLGAVFAVAVVVVATVVILDQRAKDGKATAYSGQLAPLAREADGAIVMAKAGVTKPVLEIFEDFQCPICKQMEESTGKTIKQLAFEGKVKVVYRPFHLFGQQRDPIKTNSFRSANAALCAPADKWISYHDALFKFQPPEGEKGFPDKDLVKWGKDVGVADPNFEKCVTGQQKKAQVDAMTKDALETRKIEGTPAVFLDGRKLENEIMDPKAMESVITASSGK